MDFDEEYLTDWDKFHDRRACWCSSLNLRSRVSVVAMMDICITLTMIIVAVGELIQDASVKDSNLVYVTCFVCGLCLLANILLMLSPNKTSSSILWILVHILSYITWISVIFARVRKLEPLVNIENVGMILRVTLQPFLELMTLLSVYVWFTWVLALNWIRLNERSN